MTNTGAYFNTWNHTQECVQEVADALLCYFGKDNFKLIEGTNKRECPNERIKGDIVTNLLNFRAGRFEYVLKMNQDITYDNSQDLVDRPYSDVIFQVRENRRANSKGDLNSTFLRTVRDKILQKALKNYRGEKEDKEK